MKLKHLLSLLLCLSAVVCKAQPPANYYNNAAGKVCSDLKTALKTIISTGTARSYGDLWNQYELTDVKPREVGTGSAQVIWDVYTDVPGPANDNFNFTPATAPADSRIRVREVILKVSFITVNTACPAVGSVEAHQVPVPITCIFFRQIKYVNGKRGNVPFGEVGTASFTSLNGTKLGTSSFAGVTGVVFEPIDSFKGDVARAFLYFVTRYQDNMNTYGNIAVATQAFEPNSYPSVDIPFLQLMLNWHQLDPVSQKEITRNNGAYSFQQNRNPFIDHPEYVDFVWNNTCPGLGALPVDIVYFGGKLSGAAVHLNWTVENEVSFENYEIERSFNGTSFTKIGLVKAINARKYNFTDDVADHRGRQIFYRLKKVDKDGQFSYSQVLRLQIPLNTKFAIYPNPAAAYFQVQINGTINENITLQIADITGKILQQKTLQPTAQNVKLSTDGLNNGTYVVKIIYKGEKSLQRLVVLK